MAEVIEPICFFSTITGHGFEQVGHGPPSKATPRILRDTPFKAIFCKASRPT